MFIHCCSNIKKKEYKTMLYDNVKYLSLCFLFTLVDSSFNFKVEGFYWGACCFGNLFDTKHALFLNNSSVEFCCFKFVSTMMMIIVMIVNSRYEIWKIIIVLIKEKVKLELLIIQHLTCSYFAITYFKK